MDLKKVLIDLASDDISRKLIKTTGEHLDFDYGIVFPKPVADEIFAQLEKTVEYYVDELTKVKVFGKWHNIPRQQVAYGQNGLKYTFSGVTVPAKPWSPLLDCLKNYLEQSTGYSYNFVLINKYRNGNDHIGEHRDNEKDLDKSAPIASLSFGQTRTFVFKHKDARKTGAEKRDIPTVKIELEHGSLLMMNPPLNEYWYHSLPMRKAANGLGQKMNFKDFCTFLEQIQKTKSPAEKRTLIITEFNKMRDKSDNDSFFLILRLMVPSLDRERDTYNMKEAKLARVLIKMLDLPPGKDKDVLSKSHLMSGKAVDFGDVVYSVVRKYISNQKTTLNLTELNQFLDNLTKTKTESATEDLLMKLFKKVSPDHIRWVVRIILKDLKLHIGSNSILNCYHKDGAAYYSTNNNLRKVFTVLKDENVRIHELDIELFAPFKPMLSKRIDADNFSKELPDNKLFFLENKFDGERFQLHMQNGEFKYFSRNGFDYSENFGKSYQSSQGILTPKLKGIFQDFVKTLILDGEMVLWNNSRKKFGSKGMTLDVKKLNNNGPYQPCYCVYDIVLLNGKVLTNTPLKERTKVLRQVFKTNNKEGVICVSEIKEVNTQQEIVNELNDAVAREDEGIVVKDPESVYKYSDRKGGWYKMKLEYFEDVMNDLDLLLMGGIYASSTSDQLNSFIVGVVSGSAENGRPLYLSLGKVHSGLTNEELDRLNKKLKTEGKKFQDFNSENLKFGKERPNYYIDPEKSLVFTIRATELIRNMDNSFRTTYTLRFPRVVKIRDDKPVDECLNINELMELTNSNKSVIKLNKRSIELSEISKTKTKKVVKKEIVMIDVENKVKVADMLENYTILVLSGNAEFGKEKAENFIKRAGGKVCYILNDEVDIILAGQKCDKVKNFIKANKFYDIINVNWLQRILNDGNLLDYEPEEVYYLGGSYKNCLSDNLDSFGDSFTTETSTETLKHTFQVISDMQLFSNLNKIVELKDCVKNFRNYFAYFDKYEEIGNKNSSVIYDSFLDELELRYFNGTVRDFISDDVNVVIFNGNDVRKKVLENFLQKMGKDHIEIKTRDFIYE